MIIAPEDSGLRLLPRGLMQYRELFMALVWRDLKVRYKQTAIGAAWAIVQPLVLVTVFTVFFSFVARFPSDGAPYPIFVLTGILLWQLFSRALNEASGSLVSNEALIQKIYFPRLLLPGSVVISGVVDFLIAFLVLLAACVYFDVPITAKFLFVPVLVILAVACSFGVALYLSVFYVRYRDIRHILPLLTQVWFFASPVFYPSSLVPEALRGWYSLNPMVGIIESFRWIMLPTAPTPNWSMLSISLVVMLFLIFSGFAYFQRAERTFSDSM